MRAAPGLGGGLKWVEEERAALLAEVEAEAKAIHAELRKHELKKAKEAGGGGGGGVVAAAEEEGAPVGGYASLVREKTDAALRQLAEGAWLAFVRSKSSAAVMELFLRVEGHDYFSRDRLLSRLWGECVVATSPGPYALL